MSNDPPTLRAFVLSRMSELPITQSEIAARSGLSISDVNGVVQGRIKLPGPDKRRRLAAALGVSHLDLLVAAGEITEEEIGSTGAKGVVTRSPDDPLTRCHEILDRLEPRRIPHTLRQLELIEESRQTRW